MKIGPYTNLDSYVEYKFGLGTQNCEAPNDIMIVIDSPLGWDSPSHTCWYHGITVGTYRRYRSTVP